MASHSLAPKTTVSNTQRRQVSWSLDGDSWMKSFLPVNSQLLNITFQGTAVWITVQHQRDSCRVSGKLFPWERANNIYPCLTRSQPICKPAKFSLWDQWVYRAYMHSMGKRLLVGVQVTQSSCTRKSRPSMDDGFTIATQTEGATLNLL